MNTDSQRPATSSPSSLGETILWLGWAALIAIGLMATWDAWSDIVRIATTDEEQSHIILVPIVVVWMAWVRRARLRRFRPWGTFVGPLCIALGWLLSRIGYFNSLQSLWHAGAVVVVVGTLLTGLGANFFLRFFPAFAVLVFLVPVPGMIRHQISGPLQTASAAVTQATLEMFGVPVERSMNLLSLNGHEIAVAEACNGMRMVLALVLVSYAFAFGLPLRAPARIVVLIASPIAALLCNILRLIPTVLMYGYTNEKMADTFHSVSGWMMVPLAFFILLGATRLLRWALIPVTKFNLAYQ